MTPRRAPAPGSEEAFDLIRQIGSGSPASDDAPAPVEGAQLGAFAGALIRLAAAGEEDAVKLHEEVWFIADAIPPGTSAAVTSFDLTELGAHVPAAAPS